MTARISLTRAAIALAAAAVLAPSIASAQTARVRYETAQAREAALRERLTDQSTGDQAAAAAEARKVIGAYDALVRRYPISGYADNALFNAAGLAEAMFLRYGQSQDRATAVRFYRRVGAEYPASSLTKTAMAAIQRLDPHALLADAPAPAPRPNAAASPASEPSTPSATAPVTPDASAVRAAAGSTETATAAPRARLMSIERSVLNDAVRITVALDREVAYHEETLAGPARVFFDLRGVEARAPLADAVLRYPTDAVRQIRVGRHPNSTVRVVLDLDGVKRHTVYTLYNPFRLVIDCEPEVASASKAAAAAPVPASARVTTRAIEAASAPPPIPAAAVAAPAPPLAARVSATPSLPPAAVAAASPKAVPAAAAAEPRPTTTTATPLPAAAPNVPVASAPSAPATNGAGGFSLSRQLGLGISRIVIDPGHGGHDPGAQARGLSEADLTLDIALRLEQLFQQESGIEVVLTRRTNEYIPLEERTAIANREGADLFLSIHANTSRASSASGVETYFLSFAGTPEAEAVAARENSAHGGEMHTLPDMIKAIALNNKLDESRDLAGMVQESLVARLRRSNKSVVNRGVKKAPFVVLIGAEMPSVLAEVSFLTNRQEQQLLKTAAYKQRIAEALHAAVMRYRRSLKGAAAVALQ